tara:strand:- start:107 stop:424 length:318 start_codon:yes stop_codon:yes gene_type:complete
MYAIIQQGVMDSKPEDIEIKRKRLLFRSKHRGTKEMDILLGEFYEENMRFLDAEELAEFEILLEIPDDDLYSWSVGRTQVPDNVSSPILDNFIQSVWRRGGNSSH